MKSIIHERPGVYSSYDASTAIWSGRAARVIGAAAKSVRGTANTPVTLTSYEAGVNEFGEDAPGSPGMSTMLRLLFLGGASTVVAVAVKDADYTAAFTALQAAEDVRVVVCDSGELPVHQALRTSVEAASAARLERIAGLVRTYFPLCGSIGCFARITDVTGKTDQELARLARAGYDGITIGVESGDGEALAFMDKGYAPEDIIAQTRRLDGAGIGYHFFYLAGIAGAGKGAESAVRSAEVFNRTHPRRVGSSMLTVFPESRLYQEIRAGNWTEAGEKEKLEEVRTLVEHLDIPVIFAALGASNAVNMEGRLPEDRAGLLSALDKVIAQYSEADLRRYREGLPHL